MTALKHQRFCLVHAGKYATCFKYEKLQNVVYDYYKVVIFIKYLFYHVGDQEMMKKNYSLTQMK